MVSSNIIPDELNDATYGSFWQLHNTSAGCSDLIQWHASLSVTEGKLAQVVPDRSGERAAKGARKASQLPFFGYSTRSDGWVSRSCL
jgi:hypothetical protein